MKSKVVEQIYKIDGYFERQESIPCMETVKTIELVSDISARSERSSYFTNYKFNN